MTEEEKNNLVEKEIIKRIDCILDKANYLDFEGKKEYISFKREYLQDLFDLCKKQQKEIEELKKPKFILNAETGTVTKIHNDFISKDKIRDKIKEIEEHINFENTELEDYAINVLKELLED